MPNAILDPTGQGKSGAADRSESLALALAPRRADLKGVRVGLLENTKHNAALLLDELGKLLVGEHGAERISLMTTKVAFALPVTDDVVERYRGECDVVVTGVGDCGSCSAAAVNDGILFERAGLPAAVICTEEFVTTSDAMAELHGAPGYRYVVTEHPVAVLTPEQVRDRAKRLLSDVRVLLTAEAVR